MLELLGELEICRVSYDHELKCLVCRVTLYLVVSGTTARPSCGEYVKVASAKDAYTVRPTASDDR